HDDVGTRACRSNRNTCPRAEDQVTHSRLPRTAMPPVMGRILLGAAALAAACSTLPPTEWPPHDERTIVAEYAVADGVLVALPLRGPDRTIPECQLDPARLHDRFPADQRLLELPRGCARLRVRCRYRAYGNGGAPPPPPTELFPGATIHVLP